MLKNPKLKIITTIILIILIILIYICVCLITSHINPVILTSAVKTNNTTNPINYIEECQAKNQLTLNNTNSTLISNLTSST